MLQSATKSSFTPSPTLADADVIIDWECNNNNNHFQVERQSNEQSRNLVFYHRYAAEQPEIWRDLGFTGPQARQREERHMESQSSSV